MIEMMSPWERLLSKPACGHLVQLYRPADKSPLIRNVAIYFSEGLKRGEGALAIITPEHRKLVVTELEASGIDTCSYMRNKQLLWFDAHETLSQLLMSGWPDWNRFEAVVGRALRSVKPAQEGAGLRAYGEMVDILWQTGQFAAALRLENFWNKLLSRCSFSLYCAYASEASDHNEGAVALEHVLNTHTHILPADCAKLEAAPLASAV